ncbi:MAG TPA: GIY-YIG nuclease family protein [Syntrophorhabdaceae bacterium]|nr:GIY-YIG nuclease family protein [Syntrophorhabdaceae bacterium]
MDHGRQYYVYILECADGTLYTGWTNDIEKRIDDHNNSSKGAKYTRSRRPVRLAFISRHSTLSDALKEEAGIKKMTRKQKVQLIRDQVEDVVLIG